MEDKLISDGIKSFFAIVLLTILNFYFPLLSLFVLFIWPIPIVVMAVKHGMRGAVWVILVAAIVNGVFFNPLMGVITVIGFGFVGFVLGGCINEEFSPFRTVVFTIVSVLISQSLIITVSYHFLGYNFDAVFTEALKSLSSSADMEVLIKAQLEFIKRIYPALVGISSLLTGILNYYISTWYLIHKGFRVIAYKPIKYWYFNRWLISLGLVIGLIFKSSIIFSNLNIVLLFLAFLQGFAVGRYYITKNRYKPFLNWLYIFVIIFIPLVPIALALAGLVDQWFDLRRIEI